MNSHASILLASASPRRRELLERVGVRFRVGPTHVDERLAGSWSPAGAARALAERKAAAAAAKLALGPDAASPTLVIGADTVVGLPVGDDWRLLGKPETAAQAEAMLRALSGSTHEVATGVSVVAAPSGRSRSDVEVTVVRMRTLSEREIADYVASGEWRDKAGGYAIQETADRFVVGLEGGGFDNVVGLPVERTLGVLDAVAGEEGWTWR